jgi:hypothetical protein
MVGWLDEILCIFAEPEHVGEGSTRRLGNLRSIVTVATEIGVLLFGQPCGWELDWTIRPTNDTYEMTVNGANRPQSRLSQQNPSADSVQSPISYEDVQPETPKEPRKRRRRFQDLVRSQSSKGKERERDKIRKDKDRPPLTASVLRYAPPQSTGESKAGLYRTRTGEIQSQYKGPQLEHSLSRYQQYEDRQLAEQQGNKGLAQRSRSEPHFTLIHSHGSIQYRNTFENANLPKETITHGTEDSFSFKAGVEDTVSSATRNGYGDVLQSGQSRLPKSPGYSTYNHAQESFFDAPEYKTFIPDSQAPNYPGRQLELSRFVTEQKHLTQTRRSLERSRPIPELNGPVRPSRPIIYFPALLKVGDEYGCRMTQPLLVLEPMVDRACLTPWY